MKSILNKACMSALLCGAVLLGAPALAAGVGGGIAAPGATAGINTGIGMTGPGTVTGSINATPSAGTDLGTVNGGINATAGNNVGSLGTTTQTPASQMSQRAQANANAAQARQLNPYASTGTNSQLSAGQTTAGASGGANGMATAPAQ